MSERTLEGLADMISIFSLKMSMGVSISSIIFNLIVSMSHFDQMLFDKIYRRFIERIGSPKKDHLLHNLYSIPRL